MFNEPCGAFDSFINLGAIPTDVMETCWIRLILLLHFISFQYSVQRSYIHNIKPKQSVIVQNKIPEDLSRLKPRSAHFWFPLVTAVTLSNLLNHRYVLHSHKADVGTCTASRGLQRFVEGDSHHPLGTFALSTSSLSQERSTILGDGTNPRRQFSSPNSSSYFWRSERERCQSARLWTVLNSVADKWDRILCQHRALVLSHDAGYASPPIHTLRTDESHPLLFSSGKNPPPSTSTVRHRVFLPRSHSVISISVVMVMWRRGGKWRGYLWHWLAAGRCPEDRHVISTGLKHHSLSVCFLFCDCQ